MISIKSSETRKNREEKGRKVFNVRTSGAQLLNFCSCAPLQHRKNVIQGTVHRVSNATSKWLAFHKALELSQKSKNKISAFDSIMAKTCWTKSLAARKLKQLCKLHEVFITQSLRSCLPALKSSFDRYLNSHVV